jgi:hypothetical protein
MGKNRIIGFIILVIVGSIISQCSSAKRDDAGKITKSGDLDAFVTQIGDCLNDLPDNHASGINISTVGATPCTQAHHWQVFYKSSTELDSFSVQAIKDDASFICNSALDALVGSISYLKATEYGDADLTYFGPTNKSWTIKGDRTIDCLIGSDTKLYYSSVLN